MLKYHQFRARLGVGDLHPGGAPATTTLLGWLTERKVRRVLEVGAGIGNTSARMLTLGWEVTALEPDPILFAELCRKGGIAARREAFLEHVSPAPYDAIIAESVLFQLDLARAFAHARTLLKPGGCLAFVEAVWADSTSAAQSVELHENTLRLFGIPVGSREPLTWRDWSVLLQEARFETIHAELLPRGSAGHPPTSSRAASLRAMLRDPRLVFWMARHRMGKISAAMPSGAQESWLYLGTSPSETGP